MTQVMQMAPKLTAQEVHKENRFMDALKRKVTKVVWNRIYHHSLKAQRSPNERQHQAVIRLMNALSGTVQSTDLGLGSIRSLADYRRLIPVQTYKDYQNYVERISKGESNVLFRDKVKNLVQTSGTTGYLNKLIPYNQAMLAASMRYQYRVAATIATHCKSYDPIFDDRISYATVVRNTAKSVGTISKANASELWSVGQKPWIGKNRQVLTADVLDAPDWETKLSNIRAATIGRDIRLAAGIPLYLVSIFEHLLKTQNASNLREIWPNFEAVFYSGSGISAYRNRLTELAGRPIRYFGGYLASEGLFGLPTPDGQSLFFNLDDFIYSFRTPGSDDSGSLLMGIEDLEIGKECEILVGCPNGFLNFAIGDVIRIESLSPYLTFSVLGRSLSINVANEKTSQTRIERVTQLAQQRLGKTFEHYFVHPSESTRDLPAYNWTIICDSPESMDESKIAATLDELLIAEAPDYRDCRISDGLIGPVKVQLIPSAAQLKANLLDLNQGKGQYKMKSIYRSEDEFTAALIPAAKRCGIELRV
jgi:hypothetical protein